MATRVFDASRIMLASAAKTVGEAASAKIPRVTGLTKPVKLSPQLGSFVGAPEASRPEATKKIWEHIKAHNLQAPTDKRKINCDRTLKELFGGKEQVTMFEIAKLLSPHFMK